MQRSKLFQTLRFVVEPFYHGHDMAEATVLLEYRLPGRQYKSEILSLSEELYNDFYVYLLPIDTNLTADAGKVEVQLTFLYSDLDEYGNSIQRVRKTTGTVIDIIPIAAWSDMIPDEALNAIDQRILKTDAQIKALEEMADLTMTDKVDNLNYNKKTGELQLMAGEEPVGDKVNIGENIDEDGVPVVDFSSLNDNNNESGAIDDDDESNVVEF